MSDIIGWNDTIEEDGQEFTLLPEGDYDFMVVGFERKIKPATKKLPECPKAALTLSIDTDRGFATVKTDLIMHKNLEWKLSQFFRCIGQKKHGEPLVMNWDLVPGSTGRAHITQRTYIGNDGQEHTVNDVAKFCDPEPVQTLDRSTFVPNPSVGTLYDEDIPF